MLDYEILFTAHESPVYGSYPGNRSQPEPGDRVGAQAEAGDEYLVKPDLPSWVFVICSVYLSVLFFCSVTLNLSVIVLYCKKKQLRTPFNQLLMSLILAELGSSSYGAPMDGAAAWSEGWDFGKELCLATGFLLT
ncbi:visual pigment-like receptor peropsin, partial [Eurytemora carolleeae]|uniref:visual pigment-like receptor peropsin n=1 Tax=Eurytemora carolleeae TaxID=1294199 RepID=UPI000C78F9A3